MQHRDGGRQSSASTPRVLVVEDEATLRSAIVVYLSARGFDVREAGSHAEARRRLREGPVDVVVLDHRLPDGEAFDLLPDVFARAPRPVVIVLTAYGSIDLAVRSVKEGVHQFLTKPVELAMLDREIRQCLGQRAATAHRPRPVLATAGASRAATAPVFGPSEGSQRLREQTARLKDAEASVLVLGETGTGKSLLARYIHSVSARRQGSFVEVNCTALARDLVEAELFGVERGAFTGAYAAKAGLIEAADGGTLFLDEIGDVDVGVQAKLLKVIEEKCFRRVGGVAERAVDVRIITATNRDLSAAMREGTFRADLYFRISTVTLLVPPLRERVEDIPVLTRQFLEMLCTNLRRPRATLTEEAEQALQAHSWPGNVRELKNCLERALILGDGGIVQASDIQIEAAPPSRPRLRSDAAARSLEGAEIDHIRSVLAEMNGRVDAAAALLQIPRSTLYERIRRYGIDLAELRRRRP